MGATLRLNSKGGARWHPYNHSRITNNYSAPSLVATSLNIPISTSTHAVDSFQYQAPRPQPQVTAQYLLYQKEHLEARGAQHEKLNNVFKEFCVKRLTDIWKETTYVKNSMYSRSNIRAPYPAATFLLEELVPTKLEAYLSPPLSPSPFSFQAVEVPISTHGVSLRPFVYDILRRSKTVWPTLQVALCYLDAVSDKVTEAIGEAQRTECLVSAEAALESLFNFSNLHESSVNSKAPSTAQSLVVTQTVSPPEDGCATSKTINSASLGRSTREPPRRVRRSKVPTIPPEPLPPRPSPLLCPRRIFIAALILACKFTQDRVYSNRAWARICGLDAREVSRCERALGEALEWRLWVGKDKPIAFLHSVFQNEDVPLPAALCPDPVQEVVKKTPECHLLTPQSASGSPFTSPPECSPPNGSVPVGKSMSLRSQFFYTTQSTPTQTFSRDFSSALKKTSLWCHSDVSTSQLTMTPANADLDAMDFEHGAHVMYNNRGGITAYLSPNGTVNGSTPALIYGTPSTVSSASYSEKYCFIPAAPSPHSQCTPKQATEENEFDLGMLLPAVAHARYQSGVESVELCDDDIVASSRREFLM